MPQGIAFADDAPAGRLHVLLPRLGEAHIYVSKEFPVPRVLRHGRLHAAGYGHIGSKNMQRILEKWKVRTAAEAWLADDM